MTNTPAPKTIDARPAYQASLDALKTLAEDAAKLVDPSGTAKAINALNGSVSILSHIVNEQTRRSRYADEAAADDAAAAAAAEYRDFVEFGQ